MRHPFPPPSYVPGPDLHSLAALLVGAVQPAEFKPDDLVAMIVPAHKNGLAPMLYWQLRRAGIDLTAPEWKPLRRTVDHTRMNYLQLKESFLKIQPALDAANIETVWLKGFALAHSIYPNVGLRPMRDLDVLVPEAQKEQACECVRQLGYVSQDHSAFSDAAQAMMHHYHLTGPVEVEIHHRFIGLRSKVLLPEHFEWFWTQTTLLQAGDLHFACLKPEALLLHLCAHAILQHGEFEMHLQRYLDLHLLLEKYPQLDWALVRARAIEFRWTYAVARALEFAQEYFGTPLPDGLIDGLHAHRPPDEDIAQAQWIQPDSTRLEATRILMSGMTRREALQWVWGTLFPKPDYMHWRYEIRAGWQLPFFYLRRWGDILADSVKTMLKWLHPL